MRHSYATFLGLFFILVSVPRTTTAESYVHAIIGEDQPIVGTLVQRADHPRVFTTAGELRELSSRINEPGSYSQQRFTQLSNHVLQDLTSRKAWNVAYSGCDIDAYLHTFSYEPQNTQTSADLRHKLALPSNIDPPAGAAVVASRLALYAALARAGAKLPPGAPALANAANKAKEIVLAWAKYGFRGEHGSFLSSPTQFCIDGKTNPSAETQVGLQVSRGVVYSVYAQDLLMFLGILDAPETKTLNDFHAAMNKLIQNAHNFNFTDQSAWRQDCERYSNHIASQLTALLAIARLLDDEQLFQAALDGRSASVHIALPWTTYFSHAIYGENDQPNKCLPNTGIDGFTSRPSFQTNNVVLGEIDDRNRNANPLQGMGYAMGTLQWLYEDAELLRIAGFDSYGYRGKRGQSLEAATRFYACYAKVFGFGKNVTASPSEACPDSAQYIGKIVNGVDRMIVIGAFRFPKDRTITDLESPAKQAATSGQTSVDPILFGRWRD